MGARLSARAAARARATGGSIVRSSSAIAAGTLASRITGLLRTVVQVLVLGTAALANAYNNANTLPNVVYNLVLGGILTSVIVPLIIKAAKRDRDGGEAFDQRLFTLITIALLVITVVATLAAAPIADLYKGSIKTGQLRVLVLFAYFFIPQIFFYGVSSLIGAILNARGSFAAPAWTPVINNIVVMVVLGLYVAIAGVGGSPHSISRAQIGLLGIGTTLGIAAQTVALIPAMRAVGFRWRPRFDFRRAESFEIGHVAGWMFCYIICTQVAFLVTTRIANTVGPRSPFGFSAYTVGWQLFQMPYAVVGISVITAMLPRMSAHATDRQFGLVRMDFSAGLRLASVIVVPSALVLAVLGPALSEAVLAHGATSSVGAHFIGVVFAVFCLGLLPYTCFQLQLRVFYAMQDTRTPALIGVATMVMNIVTNLIALAVLPPRLVVAGLGVGFGLANLLGAALAWRILSLRIGGLDGRVIGRSLVRMHVAAIPAALLAVIVDAVAGSVLGGGRLTAFVVVVIGGAGAAALYVLGARILRVSELTDMTRTVMARIGR